MYKITKNTDNIFLVTFLVFSPQVFEEIEIAKKQHGKLNIIVMNAVMQACVHCHDIDSALRVFEEMSKPDGCGVDDVTYGTLLKVLDCRRKCFFGG